MEQTYSKSELVQAGLDLTEILMSMAYKANDGDAFLNNYLKSLTSEDGIYKKQSDAMQNLSDTTSRIEDTAHGIMESISRRFCWIASIFSVISSNLAAIPSILAELSCMDSMMP